MMPSSFLWGAGTSAHQVEGNNIHNDWWAWEQSHPDFPKSGAACDQFRRFREDLALAKQLGHTAHRFSLEWSRIEPEEGKFNREAIEHYRTLLKELRALGMQSFVTLHHFTNPAWFANKGGWLKKENVDLFIRYVRYVAQHLSSEVDFWLTINEPLVYAIQSYYRGVWPPQHKSFWQTTRVINNMVIGHRQAYRAIHQAVSGAKVGLAHSVVGYASLHASQLDDWVVRFISDYWYNHRFIKKTAGYHDFLGLNYYMARTRDVQLFPPRILNPAPKGKLSDLGWEISPAALTELLLDFKRYKKPIYITENGIADAHDIHRPDFIRNHLRAIEVAQHEGVDVRGYLHWSLIDNFEWAEGFKPRFGLIEVDYTTQTRTIRPSAYVYKAIIEQAQRGRKT